MTATAHASISNASPGADRMAAVRAWLYLVAALVFLMVVVGGATRLTESGLSITEWKVVTGVLPPLSEAAWLAEFEKYKQIPQFGQLFPTMTLPEFKFIFFWEWGHRLLGRLIGFAFALPLAWFWWTGRLRQGSLRWKLVGLLALGGLQGAVGWWMVASGLVQRTEVAPERLAIHLTLASITFVALIATAMSLRDRAPEMAAGSLRRAAGWLVAFLLFQIALGGLVAGSRAGLTYNTWPLMDGGFAPGWSTLTSMEPGWRNFFENHATVQLQHRIGAYLLLAYALWHAWTARSVAPGSKAAKRAFAIVGLVIVQAAIGIATLLSVDGQIPLGLGLLHQGFAIVVLGMASAHWRALAAR